MKNMIIASSIVFLVMCFAPLISLSFTPTNTDTPDTQTQEPEQTKIRVLQTSSGQILNLEITEYLIGVVASEMPATFKEEALKAQAVASYTYLRWIMKNADNAAEALSDITDDSKTHQGYLTNDNMIERWGKKYETYYKKVKNAVEDVKGEFIEYNSEPINAAFHALSHGNTNNSADIWNVSLPYLVSVEAPGDKLSSDLISVLELTKDEFLTTMSIKTEAAEKIITEAEKYDNGFIKTIKIADKEYSATDIRSSLSLISPNFIINESKTGISLKVYGKGHGLGMSQYSADFMARQGEDYKSILMHFYPGTEIVKD